MNISSNIFITGLTLFFFAQATGLLYDRTTAIFIVGIIIISYSICYKEIIQFKKPTKNKALIVLLLFFFLTTAFSLIQSVDITRSIIMLGEWTTTLILALLFVNIPHIKTAFPKWIIYMGVLLCIYSILLNYFTPESLIPKNGYQLVFSKFGSHNHLGDYLVLPLLICLYQIINAKKKKLYTFAMLFFLPFFFLSYSRTAYLSFSIVTIWYLMYLLWTHKKRISLLIPTISMLFVISLAMILFLSTVFESKNIPVVSSVHQYLVSNFGLKFKHFGANRIEYAATAVQSIREKTLLGTGPGNFVYASREYSSIPNYSTHSSHNIFLDIFTENGIIAFFLFLAIIWILIKNAMRNFSIYSLLFLALLTNFQFDYTFRINSILLLFLSFSAIIITKNERQHTKS